MAYSRVGIDKNPSIKETISVSFVACHSCVMFHGIKRNTHFSQLNNSLSSTNAFVWSRNKRSDRLEQLTIQRDKNKQAASEAQRLDHENKLQVQKRLLSSPLYTE
jgi:hypothetical protein